VSLSLSSLHDVHINPVLRDFFSSTCTDAAIILKNCERQGHVAPSFFRKTMILLYHVAAPSCYFKTPPSFSHVSLGFFRKPLLCILCRRVFPLFQNTATHRHVSPSLLRLQLRYINPVVELLPVLYNTHRSCNVLKIEDTTLHVAAPSFCPQKTVTRTVMCSPSLSPSFAAASIKISARDVFSFLHHNPRSFIFPKDAHLC
jgi:hypothetical protein